MLCTLADTAICRVVQSHPVLTSTETLSLPYQVILRLQNACSKCNRFCVWRNLRGCLFFQIHIIYLIVFVCKPSCHVPSCTDGRCINSRSSGRLSLIMSSYFLSISNVARQELTVKLVCPSKCTSVLCACMFVVDQAESTCPLPFQTNSSNFKFLRISVQGI